MQSTINKTQKKKKSKKKSYAYFYRDIVLAPNLQFLN